MTLFLIGALRAIVEMLGLCLIGQGVLALLAGQRRYNNPIYRLFAVITRAPLAAVGRLFPKCASKTRAVICLVMLFMLWIGLAVLRSLI